MCMLSWFQWKLWPSSKACCNRLLNVCFNKFSSLSLWMRLLKSPSTPADRRNLKAFKDKPEETLLAQFLYSRPGPLPTPLCNSQKYIRATKLWIPLLLSVQAHKNTCGRKANVLLRLCVDMHTHISGHIVIPFFFRGQLSTARGCGILELWDFIPALVYIACTM